MNENLQDNLRSIENGVAVIDDILTQQVEDNFYENQENVRADDNRNRQPNRAPQQRDLNNNIDHINIINQVININMNNNNRQRVIEQDVRGDRIQRSKFLKLKDFLKNISSHIQRSEQFVRFCAIT